MPDESFEEQLARVRLAADGELDWDLSPNDLEALRALLDAYDDAVARLRRG